MKLPDKDLILRTLSKAGGTMTKRDLVTAFGIKGEPQRIALKNILRDMEDEGLLIKEDGKSYRIPDALPAVTVLEVTDIDIDGDLFARPAEWQEDLQGPPPRVEVMPGERGHPALKPGDRVLARVRKVGVDLYEAQTLKRLDTPQARVVGHLKQIKGGYIVSPLDRKAKYDFEVNEKDFNGAQPGMIVVCEVQPSRSALRKKVRVTEVVGFADDPKAISLMALYEVGLRPVFPPEVVAATDGMTVPPLGDRTDLRELPLVTIDGKDARDFDDAVFAELDSDQKNQGGYHLVVAIADVSYYVRPGSVIDKEAYLRGNSTYFPDRVLPMLPEGLSNDLCSLRPHEPRATLAVHMWINTEGKLLRHQFVRGLMLSRARLTYEQVQAARDGNPDETTAPLMDNVIGPLYAAWKILDRARVQRGALDLDVPERKIVVDDRGIMTGVAVRERLDAHRVIEEFMILANVAAARALEDKQAPCMYRIHDRPTGDKLMAARAFLEAFGLSLPKTGIAGPAQINHVLEKAKEMKTGFLIHEIILRSQAQAVYHPENIGHFGLALEKYAHFTSPIRRYADLLVHRSLIKAYGLGEGELSDVEAVKMEEMASHISSTERASAEAERASVDRFTAAFLKDKIGVEFTGRIGGVTRFGLFVKLDQTGADGLVPIRTLPQDFYVHDESQHALIGRRSGRVFRLGAPVLVRVIEADTLTGSTVLELVGGESGADVPGYRGKPLSASHFSPGGGFGRREKDRKGGRKGGPRKDGGKKHGEDRSQKPKSGKKGGPSKGKYR
jgi:ribonuclease R